MESLVAMLNGTSANEKHGAPIRGEAFLSVAETMAFYGHYGALVGMPDPGQAENQVCEGIETLSRLVELLPDAKSAPPGEILALASARRQLESGSGVVAPAALAELGGISLGRMHNLMTGQGALFQPVDGAISVPQALAWLEDRSAWWPSIWMNEPDEASQVEIDVPEAADGTIFAPCLKRRAGFMIGPKGSEEVIPDYDDALARMRQMDKGRWRRPNAAGNWGIVSQVGTRRMTRAALEAWRINA
ncbi:hypothetical protein V8J39_07305 [Frigidibacter sp. MR17.24]